jgi:hydroxymethylbilane synthase
MMQATRIAAGTRTSRLALWQTDTVCGLLQSSNPGLATVLHHFTTAGDRTLNRPLAEIGGKGLFTLELENALRAGAIDIAVHSLKDLPVDEPEGITTGAIVGRADVRDVLIAADGGSLDVLPSGAVVGTSSPRRRAQLLARRPDLTVRSIRGNVETRIRNVLDGDTVEQYDACVLAGAGVTRLELEDRISQWLPLEVMLPAPGQGALAVQCRADDKRVLGLLAGIDNAPVRAAVTAERAFLAGLGGGCSAPIAALAVPDGDRLRLTALVASVDGDRIIRVEGDGAVDDPPGLGYQMAQAALEKGAGDLLDRD